MDKRRFLSKFYIVLFTCMLILPCYSEDVNGADWIYYGTRAGGMMAFYDAQSIIYLPNNSARVFTKMIPSDENNRARFIMEMRKDIPTFPDNWGFSTELYEINCRNRTKKGLKLNHYDTKNELIGLTPIKHPRLGYIPTNSMEDELYKKVCVKQDLKSKGGKD